MTPDLLQPPCRAFQGFLSKLLRKFDDSLLYGPVQEPNVCHSRKAALQVSAPDELLDCADRVVLVPHPLEYVWMIPALFAQANAFVYEGFQIWTGFLQGLHATRDTR